MIYNVHIFLTVFTMVLSAILNDNCFCFWYIDKQKTNKKQKQKHFLHKEISLNKDKAM